MKYTKSDFLLTFAEIGTYLFNAVKWLAKTAFYMIATIVAFTILGWIALHYFKYALAVVSVVAITFWFYITLEDARKTREYEEREAAWFAEKRKPSHESNVL